MSDSIIPQDVSISKRCTRCGQEKPISEFYKRSMDGGHRSLCKACCASSSAVYNANHKSENAARAATYYTDHKPDYAARRSARYASMVDVQVTRKICKKCGVEKPASEFYKDPCCKNGLRPDCKVCVNAHNTAYVADHFEEISAYQTAYRIEHCEELRASKSVYYTNHKKEIDARNTAYIANHPDKRQAYTATYRSRHPEECRARTAAWAAEHPEEKRAYKHRRRARERGAEGTHTAQQLRDLLEKQKGKCAYCKTAIKLRVEVEEDKKKKCHVDHITALAKGGSNHAHNIQLLCPKCNLTKGAADPIDFAQRQGLLL